MSPSIPRVEGGGSPEDRDGHQRDWSVQGAKDGESNKVHHYEIDEEVHFCSVR